MASPTPDPSVLDPSKNAPVSADELNKASINGTAVFATSAKEAASPTKAESPTTTTNDNPITEAAPIKVNGNGIIKSEEDGPRKSSELAQDIDQRRSSDLSQQHAEDLLPEKEEATAGLVLSPSKPSEEIKLAPVEDVDMSDSAPIETKQSPPLRLSPKPEEAAGKPTANDPVVDNESMQDVEMTDKDPAPIDDTKKSEGASSSSEVAAAAVTSPTTEVDLQPASMSQLAIESVEPHSPLVEASINASVDAAMTDAPSGKVAREREDDVAEEPAPKRARTEPKEDDQIIAASLDASGSIEPSSPNILPLWTDSENSAKLITSFQRREIRKVLARVRKTKHGGSFKESVEKLWPGLWESYSAKIERPMDLGEIDRGMRDPNGTYKSFGDFKKDMELIYDNTLKFNGPNHDVTMHASSAIKNIWDDVVTIPSEEPSRPKPVPKAKPIRESRAAFTTETSTRRQSAGPVSSPAAPAPAPAPVEKSKPEPVAAEPSETLRRMSTATDADRPKRTVRAPKPKDIDYSTKPSRKKLKPELQFCDEVLVELMSGKNWDLNRWFLEPVDAEGLNIPQYYSQIKKPMDLGKVSRMLQGGEISSLKEFDKIVRLVFDNCYQFNGPTEQGNPVSLVAEKLENLYKSQMKGKDAWLSKHAKANRQASTSNASDDNDDDDETDDVAPSANSEEVEKLEKDVKGLEGKLREESAKLNDLFIADTPQQSMINIQQNLVKMVQEALLASKTSLNTARQKEGKAGKKASGKASKSKSSGGTRKSSTATAQPKKSGAAKKGAKKSLTASDKDAIANAINDLEYPHLERAIDIIKRDTGQNENNDGELELDIDQLSNDALLKLWELCKKVLPSFGKDPAAANASSQVNRGPNKQAHKSAAKPKKNKPMSAQEQEARIAQLRGIRDLYKGGPDGEGMDMPDMDAEEGSSEESDSEEE